MTTAQKQSGYLECGGGQTPLWLCVDEYFTYRRRIAHTAKAVSPFAVANSATALQMALVLYNSRP